MSRGGTAGVFTTDLGLVVQSWDRWLEDATGVAEGDVIGRALTDLYPDLEERGLLARLRRAASAGTVEVLAPAFHGYLLPCPPRPASAHFAHMQQHVTVAPLRIGDEIVGVSVTIEDVTARRERDRELATQLASPDDAVRLHAVRVLGAEDGPVDSLAGALGDASWRVRRAAAEGLARGRDDAAVRALLAAVRERHRDPAVLNAALAALVGARHEVVAPLAELLGAADSDADVRTYAALALGLLEDRRAVPALLRALGDDDANVRFHATEALGRIRSREAAHPVAEVAESRDFAVAFAALDALALIAEPSVAPRLVPLLDDDLLQAAAAEALGRLGGEEAAGPLAGLLAVPDAPVPEVARALATLHARLEEAHGEGRLVEYAVRAVVTPSGVRALIDALARASDDERHGLVVVLGWLDADGVEDALAGTLSQPGARRAAADTLARRGASAVAALRRALATDDDEARKAAAAALGRIGSPDAVPALLGLLDAAPEVAVIAAGALGSIGDPRAFEPLVEHLDDAHAAVRQAAVAALDSIAHPDTPARVRLLLDDPSPRVREAAARIAGYLGHSGSLEPVLARCEDGDEAVRRTAVEQLAHAEDPRARATLLAALATGTPGVRAAAVRALGHVEPAHSLPAVLTACDDADTWVRYYAARSAGRHRRAEAVPTLVRLVHTDPVPPVRIAALDALVEIGAADGLAVAAPLAADPDTMLARAALLALGGSDDPATLPPLLAALAADDHGRQLAALDALGRRRDPAAVPVVAELARADGDPEVTARALETLARMDDAAAIAALVAIAADPRRTPAAVSALARLDERQVAWVGDGLAHPEVHVRCAVIEALGRMPHRAAQPLLAGALEDPAPAVRLAAAHALHRIDLRAARATDRARTNEHPRATTDGLDA